MPGGEEEEGAADCRGEVEITAGLTGDPGLVAELDLYHRVRLGREGGAHEARVTAALDVGDGPPGPGLPAHHPLAGQVGVLGVEPVLEVPQLEAPPARVDVELDGAVQGAPAVVALSQPVGQLAPGPGPGYCNVTEGEGRL